MNFFASIRNIFIFSLFLRILAIFFYGEYTLAGEFEPLVMNMVDGNGYSYWTVDSSGLITQEYIKNAKYHIPSAYMPILYPLFLYPFIFLFGYTKFAMVLILAFQSLLGVFSCVLLQKIYNFKFGLDEKNLVSILLSIFPLHIFMSTQISASNAYTFLIIMILYLYSIIKDNSYSNKTMILIGLFGGMLAMSRGDGILIIPFIILLSIINENINFKNVSLIIISFILIIAPNSLRNNHHFDMYYPLTVSGGLNLWCGNNIDATGSRYNYVINPRTPIPKHIIDKINEIPYDNMYEIKHDEIFKDEALKFIKNNPLQVVNLSIKKFIFFWIHIYDKRIDYPGNNNFMYYGPWLLLMPFFISFLIKNFNEWRKHDLEFLLIMYFSTVYSVFFVLPRYRLIVLPIYLLFSALQINKFLKVQKKNDKLFSK